MIHGLWIFACSRCSQDRYFFRLRHCLSGTHVGGRESRRGHAAKVVAGWPDRRQIAPLIPAGPPCGMTDSKPTRPISRGQTTPAGVLFLAITSLGWGFNWPVTEFLIGELPPLTLRGLSGVAGALLLAALAVARG